MPLVLAVVALFCAACEADDLRQYDWSQFGSESPDSDTDAAGDGDTDQAVDLSELDPADVDLHGVWAQLHVSSSVSPRSLDGQTTSRTVTTWRLVYEQNADRLIMHARVCSVDIQSASTVVTTIVPDAFVASLEKSDIPAQLFKDDNGVLFYQPPFTEVRGAKMDDDPQGVLPADASDNRVYDQDGDSHPGVTVRIVGLITGELYIIQRRTNELIGRVTGTDTIDGQLIWNNEQVTLGSDNPTLEKNQPDYVPDLRPNKSFFRSTRIDSSVTCEEIVSQAIDLFWRDGDTDSGDFGFGESGDNETD
jgi:hypothetical protein